jgi:hypothetical protein
MKRKIPPEAFPYYLGLGVGRSYEAVAQHFGVSKRAVVSIAEREDWQQRVTASERKVRERVDQKAVETLEAMNTRHMKTLQAVLGRALEALRSMPLNTSMDAVRAIEMVVRQERAIRGDGDRSFEDLEARIREELDFVMVTPGAKGTDWKREGTESAEGSDEDGDKTSQ